MTRSAIFRTASGATIDLLNPDWSEISLDEVAAGLAAIRRFNGQARPPRTLGARRRTVGVIEHQLRVGDGVAPRWRLPALLHDAHEFAIGDVVTPTLIALDAMSGGDVLAAADSLKWGLDVAIGRRVLAEFGPAFWPDGQNDEIEATVLANEMRCAEVRRADRDAYELEARAIGVSGGGGTLELLPALSEALQAQAWLDAVRDAARARYGEGRRG